MVAASSCIAGMAWEYLSRVNATEEGPSRSCTTFGWTLACKARVASLSVHAGPHRANGFQKDALLTDYAPSQRGRTGVRNPCSEKKPLQILPQAGIDCLPLRPTKALLTRQVCLLTHASQRRPSETATCCGEGSSST